MAKDFKTFISSKDVLSFFDFEATQFSNEPIQIGLVAYSKDFQMLFSYQSYIKTSVHVEPLVRRMTHITDAVLEKEGKDKTVVLKEIVNLLRPYQKKAFLSYGDQDLRILKHFISKETFTYQYYSHIYKNYFDFQKYVSSLLFNKNEFLSLADLCSIFDVTNLNPHEAYSDALSLATLYQKILKDEKESTEKLNLFLKEKIEKRSKADGDQLSRRPEVS